MCTIFGTRFGLWVLLSVLIAKKYIQNLWNASLVTMWNTDSPTGSRSIVLLVHKHTHTIQQKTVLPPYLCFFIFLWDSKIIIQLWWWVLPVTLRGLRRSSVDQSRTLHLDRQGLCGCIITASIQHQVLITAPSLGSRTFLSTAPCSGPSPSLSHHNPWPGTENDKCGNIRAILLLNNK